MPQTFQVLRCYKCLVFQVHQTKKSIKWECKLCGEKQSIKRHYGIGTGKDCRIHVQKLNSLRGEIDELKCGQMARNQDSDEASESESLELQECNFQPAAVKDSKWSNYVEQQEEKLEEPNEPMLLGDAEVVLEIPKKRRKQFQSFSRTNRYSKTEAGDYGTRQNTYDKVNTDDSLSISTIHSVSSIEPASNFGTGIFDKENRTKAKVPHKTFAPPVLSKNSKWAEFNETDAALSPDMDKPQNNITKAYSNVNVNLKYESLQPDEIKKGIEMKKKFIPPVLNKNSKWAQFADADDETTDTLCSQNLGASQSKLMFSQCDETELDNVLDL
ncbi:uncharacterized protein LOC142981683 [Anticarsia gemmatalis]|uniref:uncharacterized protein LOC142981683 n=1 Tax=Anticarsia gemmatalis TaxID=129554 RepID=UPI003F7745FE